MTKSEAIAPPADCELARKNPQLFTAAVREYSAVLELAVEESVSGTDRHALARVRALARKLGEVDSLPQDLISVHLAALTIAVKTKPHAIAKACVRHSRVFLVKLVGELALFYREQARASMR